MSSARYVRTTVLFAASLVACSGSKTPTVSPAPTASVTASAAPAASASAEAPAPPPRSPVDVLEARLTSAPDKLPVVRVEAPKMDQVVSVQGAKDLRVRFTIGNFDKLPEGSFAQVVLDGVPFRPVTSLKDTVKLGDLVPGGQPLGEGEHVLGVYAAFKNREAIRAPQGIDVTHFWVGKKGTGTWKEGDPLLVVGTPAGSYPGDGSVDILFDFYVINATLGAKEHTIRAVLHGPRIDENGVPRLLNEWKPLLVLSAPEGSYTLDATLLDPGGKPVANPWNPTKLAFTVEPRK